MSNIYMVATHRNTNDSKDTVLGFRLLDVSTKEAGDYEYKQVEQLLKQKKSAVSNLAIDGGAIKCTQGDLGRYPRINSWGTPGVGAPLLILGKMRSGYLIANYKGQVLETTNDSIIGAYQDFTARMNRGGKSIYDNMLANAKIVFSQNGLYISGINHEIPVLDANIQDSEASKQINNLAYIIKCALNGVKSERGPHDYYNVLIAMNKAVYAKYFAYTLGKYVERPAVLNNVVEIFCGISDKDVIKYIRSLYSFQTIGVSLPINLNFNHLRMQMSTFREEHYDKINIAYHSKMEDFYSLTAMQFKRATGVALAYLGNTTDTLNFVESLAGLIK